MLKTSARTSAAIFGSAANACNMTELARITGIPRTTLHRYKRQPESMPLWALRAIVKARGMAAPDIERIVKG